MARTRHHQAGYVFRKGSNWYVRYREDVQLEKVRFNVSRNATNLRKPQANIGREMPRTCWPRNTCGQSTAATSGQKVQ
jgi:hypothetical protein